MVDLGAGASRAAKPFDIGRTIGKVFSAFQRNGTSIALLTLLWVIAPNVIAGFITMNAPDTARLVDSLAGLPQNITIGGVIYAVLRDLDGAKPGFAESQAAGFRLFWPMLGIAILSSLGIGVGMLFLLVPGVFLAMMWSVALPARVAEGPGVGASMHRSRTLTKGYRWPIFALYLVFAGPTLVVYAAVIMTITRQDGWAGNPFVTLVLLPLLGALVTVVPTVMSPVIYTELKGLKGGGGAAASVAEIFD